MKRGTNEYTSDWPEIARQAKEDARWKCRHCGHNHDPESGYCLTVHHLDIDKSNNDPANLLVSCQRCHLRIQAVYIPGQLWLPGFCPDWRG